MAPPLSFAVVIAAGVLLGRRWPDGLRRVARFLAAVIVVVLLGIFATGWLRDWGPAAVVHRWLPHALFILAWNAVPFSVGVSIARPRGRPLAAAGNALASLSTLGVIFLASVTGYLGPSHGALSPMTQMRFRALHFWALPALALVLSAVWYHGLGPRRSAAPRCAPGPPAPFRESTEVELE